LNSVVAMAALCGWPRSQDWADFLRLLVVDLAGQGWLVRVHRDVDERRPVVVERLTQRAGLVRWAGYAAVRSLARAGRLAG
jgi:hypothetical protein